MFGSSLGDLALIVIVSWPGMTINVSVQYNCGFLPDIVLLTQGTLGLIDSLVEPLHMRRS